MPVIKKFNKKETALAFFTKGESCIKAGELLFNNRNSRNHICDEILLIHGIELILASFLLKKDREVKSSIDIYRKYRHNYRKIYDRCVEIDKERIISDRVLRYYINFLSENYFTTGVETRFPKEVRLDKRPNDVYFILKKGLVKPLKKVFISNK